MPLTPDQQALVEDIVRLVSRGTDRPCTNWTPDTDPHERFRVTVCVTCHFPEAFHLLARSLEQIAAQRADVNPWDPARGAVVTQLVADLRQRIAERAPLELIAASLDAVRVYALEPRPSGAFEKDAAGILRSLQAAAKGIESKDLETVVTAATDWLDRYDRETIVAVAVEP